MKSFRILAGIAAAGLALTACTSAPAPSGAPSAPAGNCGDAGVYCIGLVTDMGKIDDKSFNQSAWEGIEAAGKEIPGAKTKYIETSAATDYAANIKKFVDGKYNVIVTVGFNLAEATTTAAKANPNIKFIGVDQGQTDTIANLTGLVFPEDQAGYAVGYLAGKLTKTNKLGQVLGMQIPPVEKFAKGFIAGAKASNATATVTTVYHPAGNNAFGDPTWGAAEAQKQLDQKADVIFGAGGGTGNGALGQVAKAPGAGTSVFCIGVDTDQWFTVPEAHGCLVTSAEKKIADGTAALVKAAKDGSIKGGNWVGKAGISPFHDFDAKVPQAVKDEVAKVVADLASGALKTGVTLG
ncbi:MAG: BMP family ABC transporter substrate-binding protein [Propionibacteriales bacterium]|nr:BMP family ABC transporter substrate-binding protein [Propionibacteriales bacterium]